jgi:hypothetical protein
MRTDRNASRRRAKPERTAVSDTVSAVKGARVGGLLARGLIAAAAAIIVLVATLLTWPWTAVGPSPDERRIADLQRLSHAVDTFRARQHILPASLVRLPIEPAAPVHIYDPVTNRLYDYRPLGPLAYELCARFDAAQPEAQRDFWWHDAGRYCFALETSDRSGPQSAGSSERAAPAASAESRPDVPVPDPSQTPSQTAPDSSDTPAAPPAPSGPPEPGGAGATPVP